MVSTLGSVFSTESLDVKPTCHVCSSAELLKKFSIPLVDGPYQHDHDEDESIRTIYECNECGHLSGDLYDTSRFSDYYASLADDYYSSHDYDQSRYKQILGTLPNQSVMRVLDIGCGTGTFLAMLPPGTERFGIEPSRAAANRARAEGVETIQYDDLLKPELRNTFDLVTAIDVVEHTANLLELRRYFSAALRPGGTLIILTGDAKSESARFLGRYWSYLNYAEHITIFCPRSMRTWLKADFSVTQLTKTDHHPLHLREGLSLIRIWLLFPVKWLCRKLLPMRLDMYTALWLPGDHMLVRAIRKPS